MAMITNTTSNSTNVKPGSVLNHALAYLHRGIAIGGVAKAQLAAIVSPQAWRVPAWAGTQMHSVHKTAIMFSAKIFIVSLLAVVDSMDVNLFERALMVML